MGKNPAFQFYPADWRADLDDCPLEIEGAWIRICCRLWNSETKGKMTKTLDEWSRILRLNLKNSEKILRILIENNIASGEILDNQITIISRRMVRDAYLSEIRAKAGILGGNPIFKTGKPNPYYDKKDKQKDNQNQIDLLNQNDKQKITPSSSSSSSSSNNKINIFKLSETDFMEWLKREFDYIDLEFEFKKMDRWMLLNPNRRKTRGFIVKWLNKIEKPMGQSGSPDTVDKRILEAKEAMKKHGYT